MKQEPLFVHDDIDRVSLNVTDANKGKSRELLVASDLMKCGLQVYLLAATNGSPDICVIDPRSPDVVIRVEVTGANPASNGNGIRPSGNHDLRKYDVLAMVNEQDAIIIYRPDRFTSFNRYKPASAKRGNHA